MQVVSTVKEVRDIVAGWRKEGKTVGFVPTMGEKRIYRENYQQRNDILTFTHLFQCAILRAAERREKL